MPHLISRTVPLAAIFVLTTMPAVAHPGHAFGGWTDGFTHPFSGLDHLIAMIAVGLWAAQHKGHARWVIPGTFVTVMTVGGGVGAMGVSIPGAEAMILASVLVLALLVFTRQCVPLAAGAGLIALFAFFHGFAHGREMPDSAGLMSFGLGFLTATALLHGGGYMLGRAMSGGYWNRFGTSASSRS